MREHYERTRDVIDDYRKQFGFSQTKLAAERGLSESTVKSWFRNKGHANLPEYYSLRQVFTHKDGTFDEEWHAIALKTRNKEETRNNSCPDTEDIDDTSSDTEEFESDYTTFSQKADREMLIDLLFKEEEKRTLSFMLPELKTFETGSTLNRNDPWPEPAIFDIERIQQVGIHESEMRMYSDPHTYHDGFKNKLGFLLSLDTDTFKRIIDGYLKLTADTYAHSQIWQAAQDDFYWSQWKYDPDIIRHKHTSILAEQGPYAYLTLDGIYKICLYGMSAQASLCRWISKNEGITVDSVVFNNCPWEFKTFPYFEHDAEHDNFFPYTAEEVLNRLILKETRSITEYQKPNGLIDMAKAFIGSEKPTITTFETFVQARSTGIDFVRLYDKIFILNKTDKMI